MQPTRSFDRKLPVCDTLLDPKRIESLNRCDKDISSYDPHSFLVVFRIRGRHFEMILLPLLSLLIWDVFWCLSLITYEDPLEIGQYIQSMESLLTPILMPVSFLLVFRLGRAAIRYWDARAALGKLVEVCRTTASTALVACPTQKPALAENFVRWIGVFPVAVKNFLRPWDGPDCDRQAEVGTLLSTENKQLFLAHKGTLTAPILVLNRLRQLAHQLACCSANSNAETAAMSGALLRQLNEQIDTLTGAWGAMERINGTPLPFVYVVHLRTFLLLYLFLWHMEAIASSGWISLLPLLLASWGLLGIEAAAVECERPFQWHSNHLALGKACIVVARNLAQTYENLGWATKPTTAPPQQDRVNGTFGPRQGEQPAEKSTFDLEASA